MAQKFVGIVGLVVLFVGALSAGLFFSADARPYGLTGEGQSEVVGNVNGWSTSAIAVR
jgi:hypothetical protein